VIFVTVGNATQGFRRLLDAVDQFTGDGLFPNDDVFIQSGNNREFIPVHCKHEPFLSMEDFTVKIREAAVVVCHAGATLFQVIQAGKVPVVMPRRKKYGEIIDDHQLELTQALAQEGRIIPAYEPEELPVAITEARRRKPTPVSLASKEMLQLVAKAIEDLVRDQN
jgi:UDP-N-acetylglucosamine transferase subunit ALG13